METTESKRLHIYYVVFLTGTLLLMLIPSRGVAMGAMGWYFGTKCSAEAKALFTKYSPVEQVERFKALPIEDRYSTYLCGLHVIHPPALHLTKPFAAAGKSVVPFLEAKLGEADDNLTIFGIIRIFSYMNRMKTYDVAGDKNLMNTILYSVTRMKDDEPWKGRCEEMINEIAVGPRGRVDSTRTEPHG